MMKSNRRFNPWARPVVQYASLAGFWAKADHTPLFAT